MKTELLYLAKQDDFVVANYDFNLETQRLFFACLYKMNSNYINPIENELSFIYTLNFEEIKALIGIDYAIEHHKKVINRAKKDLTQKIVEIKTKTGNTVAGIVKSFRTNEINKTILIEIDKDIKPFLAIDFKRFTKFGFKHLSLCQSKYTFRLYEILISKGKKNTEIKKILKLSVYEIRNMLKVPKSVNYNQFKTRVLEKANIEFNALDVENKENLQEKKLFKSFEYKEFIEKKGGRGRKPVSHIIFEFELLEETELLMMSRTKKIKKELDAEDWIMTEIRLLIDKNKERDSYFKSIEINALYGFITQIIQNVKEKFEVYGNLNQNLIKKSLDGSFNTFSSKFKGNDFHKYLIAGLERTCLNYLQNGKDLQGYS